MLRTCVGRVDHEGKEDREEKLPSLCKNPTEMSMGRLGSDPGISRDVEEALRGS